MKEGLIIVYTGGGKGKTTAALGLAVRAVGYKMKILMVQFIKQSWVSGETEGVRNLPNFELISRGKGFVKILDGRTSFEEHKKNAQETLKLTRKKIKSKKYDIVILDEINYAVKGELISLNDVVKLIKERPKKTTLVLTGNYAHPKIIEMANLVTEMKEIKYPFKKETVGKKGIDF